MLDVTLEQLQYMKKFILKYDDVDVDWFLQSAGQWYSEDYEKEDMEKLYKKYPELMYMISPRLMYRLQKFFNEEIMCASWCGVFNLSSIYRHIIEFEESNKELFKGEL